MNIKASQEFIKKRKDKILNLFLTYQMIELMLFAKLYFPEIPDGKENKNILKTVNKELNSKTLGKLRYKYLSKFPKDKLRLEQDLKTLTLQRNSFMHSLWMIIAVAQDTKKITIITEDLLDVFSRNADKILKKIYKN